MYSISFLFIIIKEYQRKEDFTREKLRKQIFYICLPYLPKMNICPPAFIKIAPNLPQKPRKPQPSIYAVLHQKCPTVENFRNFLSSSKFIPEFPFIMHPVPTLHPYRPNCLYLSITTKYLGLSL
jgi:hypothetical protein